MKKLILVVLFSVLLVGCKPMTYDEVGAANKWCTDRNMKPTYFEAWGESTKGGGFVYRVICVNDRGQYFKPVN